MPDSIMHLLRALEATGFATDVRESGWLFPAIETLHVMAIVLVVGTIWIVDLRIVGVASRERSIGDVLTATLPYTWTSFAIAAISGFLLFASSATTYAINFPFRIKMLLLLFAGTNMLLFHWFTRKGLHQWDGVRAPPTAMRLAGCASIAFWCGVVCAGRWIGFTL